MGVILEQRVLFEFCSVNVEVAYTETGRDSVHRLALKPHPRGTAGRLQEGAVVKPFNDKDRFTWCDRFANTFIRHRTSICRGKKMVIIM